MKTKKRSREKKVYTVAQANAALPLVRAIVRDVTELARELKDRQDHLARAQANGRAAREAELVQAHADFERDQERMLGYLQELQGLGVELKDFMTGLVDFPSAIDDREIYLCWRMGEPEVAHWHELDAGFQGRQKLMADAPKI